MTDLTPAVYEVSKDTGRMRISGDGEGGGAGWLGGGGGGVLSEASTVDTPNSPYLD